MSLRTVHIRGDGFCFARFTLFLLAEDARDTCFLSRASVKEDLLGGGKAAAAEWVPTKRMHMCARVTPCPLRARNTVPPPTHTHTPAAASSLPPFTRGTVCLVGSSRSPGGTSGTPVR